MRIHDMGPGLVGHLLYEAPVNEATKKLRERFDVDEETGYPRAYNWRSMARLGKEYKYEDPYLKFDPVKDEQLISQRYFLYSSSTIIVAVCHYFWTRHRRVPVWSKLQYPIGVITSFCLVSSWIQKQVAKRYNKRNAILIDYTRKHPERFGTVYRPKLREILAMYGPPR